ncbi:lipase family alpha/beta hydrolase [Actinomadura kijaniata]|uniref:lipase family alpha/beta hydrolase n=1 Tax=Actinomadura kijaniata TaxID=46161 RepID=UPI003F1DE12A
MRAEEIQGLGELAGITARAGVERVHQTHRGIAARVFRGVGPASAPVRLVHDGIAAAVYTAVGRSLETTFRATGAAASRAATPASLDDRPSTRIARSILNGWYGDRLEARGNALALPMTVRAADRDVPLTREALADAHRPVTRRVAVFLHGLTETEGAWAYKSRRHHGRPGVTYGDRLRADLGYTPVRIRYNTGLRVHVNGRHLDDLLETLTARWPVPVDDLLLVGHSMGGLVIRSALAQATRRGAAWPARVRDTITLGTPHLGAPLEQGAALAVHALNRVAETRAVAALVDARSAGIKDLRHGDVLDRPRAHVPLHEGARHFIVVGTVGRRPGSRAADLLGDLLVRPRSACGGSRFGLPEEHICRVPGVHHFDLLNHPGVYAHVKRWLTGRPAGEPAAREA